MSASRSCSGCGAPNTRIDFCLVCSPDSPRTHDARSLVNPRAPRSTSPRSAPRAAPKPPPAPRRTSVIGISLVFVPFGSDTPVILEARMPTTTDAQRLAETYNKLDWQEHQSLGSDKMIALGRRGAFILEPVTR